MKILSLIKYRSLEKSIILLVIATLITHVHAQNPASAPDDTNTSPQISESFFRILDPKPENQFWINPGMVSYHFQQDKNLNGGNWGTGLEYRLNTVASLTAGRFYNSDRQYSNYAGVYYQPMPMAKSKLAQSLVVLTATQQAITEVGLLQLYQLSLGKVTYSAPIFLSFQLLVIACTGQSPYS